MAGPAARVSAQAARKIAAFLEIGFADFLATSYQHCKYFKTILDASDRLDINEKYLSISLQIGRHGNVIADDDLIELIFADQEQYAIITGLAGSGKSMLLKYFVARSYNAGVSRIPIFIELRDLDETGIYDLTAFIRSRCSSADEQESISHLDFSLKNGAFILVLDGFDELKRSSQEKIQTEIMRLARRYPKLPFLLSSRPDDRFASWNAFQVYHVTALDEQQVRRLVGTLNYDENLKRRFLIALDQRLFETHSSFLAFPLLVIIMLLTYEEFAEIPARMHQFYGRAFDTLLHRHDTRKKQFRREFMSGMEKEDFRVAFAAFCGISYKQSKISFSLDDAIAISQRALKFLQTTRPRDTKMPDPESFVSDLQNAVCILQPDGLKLTFVHRSFQEYFAAAFVSFLSREQIRQLLNDFATRLNDSVVAMAIDIARDKVEPAWVLPCIEIISNFLDLERKRSMKNVERLMKIYTSIEIRLGESPGVSSVEQILEPEPSGITSLVHSRSSNEDPNRALDIYYAISKIYPKSIQRFLFDAPLDRIRSAVRITVAAGRPVPIDLVEFLTSPGSEHQFDLLLSTDDEWWLNELGLGEAFDDLRREFINLSAEINMREATQNEIIEGII